MFEFLALLIGAAAVDSAKRSNEIERAKAEGKPYYFHGSKRYSVETGEPLIPIGRGLMGAYSRKIVYNPANEDLKKANEGLERRGKKYHYEIDYTSKYHENRTGYIKVDNATGKQFIIEKTIPWHPYKPTEYKFYFVDRVTGEPISEIKLMTYSELEGWM